MAKAKTSTVSFKVVLNGPKVEKLYIVGNTPNLGNWDPKSAVALKLNEDGSFSVNKRFPIDTEILYKVLAKKSFDNVELGMFNEPFGNHKLQASESKVVSEVVVYNFAE